MNMTIHPFPARMAPELALQALKREKKTIRVLDPMSGSGTALRHASVLGHEAVGRDLDPLAVLMAKVWTTPVAQADIEEAFGFVVRRSLMLDPWDVCLHWIDNEPETKKFVEYWFGREQIIHLRCLAWVLTQREDFFPESISSGAIDVLKIALTRIIITKEQCASLARDTSHSRPHKVAERSDYDVIKGFHASVQQVLKRLCVENLVGKVSVELGDARALDLPDGYFDAIVTSPPYLNAIDYMRGHKFGLVWLGYSIPQLRNIRSTSVGAEKAPDAGSKNTDVVLAAFGDLERLSNRHVSMIRRFAGDLVSCLAEAYRVLSPGGIATYVVGNSCLKGVFINNANAVVEAGISSGFSIASQVERELPPNRRYLPIVTESNLRQRMRTETIIVLEKNKK